MKQNGAYTCLPITLYGKAADALLTITLTDESGREYCFADIPATTQMDAATAFVNRLNEKG